jgi:hypothetical protein
MSGSPFTSDFSTTREATANILMFGQPKIGKTHAALDIVRKDPESFIMLLSFDKGSRPLLHREPEVFSGKVALAEPKGLKEIRRAIYETGMKVRKLIKAGVQPSKIWIVVDTITHLQYQFMQEARRINQSDPTSQDRKTEDFARDFTTQIDWGINLTLMGEQADDINMLPANKLYIALEKTIQPKNQPERCVPAVSGQSKERFTGDADAIIHLVMEKGERMFVTGFEDGGGDRFSRLDPKEPVDLNALHKKIFATTAPAKGADSKK